MTENAVHAALAALPPAEREDAALRELAALRAKTRRQRDDAVIAARLLWPDASEYAAAVDLAREIVRAGQRYFVARTARHQAAAKIRELNLDRDFGERAIRDLWRNTPPSGAR